MDNKIKRYLDRVVMELMGSTVLDYEKKKIHYPFSLRPFSFSSPLFSSFLLYSLSEYCKNTFGLTDDEIDYVWKECIEIIKDKIEDGQ